jgi:hypothetical protein
MKLKELIHDYYLSHNAAQSSDVIANEIVNIVKDWISSHHIELTKYDTDYWSGYEDCLDTLKKDIR